MAGLEFRSLGECWGYPQTHWRGSHVFGLRMNFVFGCKETDCPWRAFLVVTDVEQECR